MKFERTEISPTICRVALQGRGDAPGIEMVEASFTATVVSGGCHVVLDLAAVPFMGSLGIRMLINSARVLSRRQLKMVITNVDPLVQEVFDTVALAEIIPFAPDEAGALALLAG